MNRSEKTEKYEELLKQADVLFLENEPVITALANFTALLFQSVNYISWCGFYLAKENRLFLGPFQGKVACEFIDFGKGVCGGSAEKRKTIIVPDVHKYDGHIACDSGTNSEIVIPIIYNDEVFGALDLDSYEYAAFDETDKIYLEKMIEILKKNVRLDNYQLT